MKILTRYVFREFCVPLFYCLTGFLSIYLLFELFGSFSRLMSAKPGFGVACQYLAGYLAPYFEWMAPACLMLATLYTMWSFCRHSELIAMRASGIGFFTIVKPLLFGATLMAICVGMVNELYVPRYGQWAKLFKSAHFNAAEMERTGDLVYHNPQGNRTWRIGMTVTEDAHVLEDVAISVNTSLGVREMTVKSARAEYLDGIWFLMHPEVAYFNEHGEEMASPTPELENLSLRPFPQFTERPEDILLQSRDWNFCSTAERLRFLKVHSSLTPQARRDRTYDLWAHIVAPFACIVITLFAIPAGIATGRQSVFKGILGALGLFFSFYGLTILCMALSRWGILPPIIAAFLPDTIFFLIGLRLFWRQR